jgi:hypothetical protein
MKKSSVRRLRSSLLAAALLPVMAGLPARDTVSQAAAAGQQTSHHKPSKTKNPPANPTKELPVPFRAGEKLNYQVGWSAFLTAALVQLSVPERRDFYGWSTWHFRATAHTQGTARTLFPIDDEFDSYTDAAMTESRQYETYLNEMGRKQDQVLHFVVEGQANKAPGAGVIVLPRTLDPLGALYSLRAIDWQKTPEWSAPVYDGRDVYELHAKMEAPIVTLAVAGGTFSATRISLHVWQHGRELSGIDFSVWLAHDAARTPVLIQAELPLGSVRVELTSSSQ